MPSRQAVDCFKPADGEHAVALESLGKTVAQSDEKPSYLLEYLVRRALVVKGKEIKKATKRKEH